MAPPESVEEVISPTSVQPSSVSTTPRRSTAESTEQEEESSEEENEPEAPPKPTVFHPVQTKGINFKCFCFTLQLVGNVLSYLQPKIGCFRRVGTRFWSLATSQDVAKVLEKNSWILFKFPFFVPLV